MPRARNCACSRDDVLFNWWHGGDEGRATCGVRLASPLPSPGVREGAATVRARVVRRARRTTGGREGGVLAIGQERLGRAWGRARSGQRPFSRSVPSNSASAASLIGGGEGARADWMIGRGPSSSSDLQQAACDRANQTSS